MRMIFLNGVKRNVKINWLRIREILELTLDLLLFLYKKKSLILLKLN